MLGRLWPRFALEAIFLVAVAVTAGLLDLTVAQIVAVMVGAYLLTVAVELGAWRLRRSRPPATPVLAGTTMQVLEPEPEAVAEDEPEPEPLVEEEPEEELEPVAEEEPEPEPVAEEEPEPVAEEPEVEPEPEEEPEPVAEEEPEPEPEAEPEPVRLVAVPGPAPPAPEPEPELEREPEPEPAPAAVATLPLPPEPQAWNLWELERLAREAGASDPDREQELGYLVVYLREFASPDGLLPAEFDELVRDSFGELLAGGRR